MVDCDRIYELLHYHITNALQELFNLINSSLIKLVLNVCIETCIFVINNYSIHD